MDDTTILSENEWVLDTSSIMFCDVKDFTLKTSLLTTKQIDEILWAYEKMISHSVDTFSGHIVKAMWDAYMIVFVDRENAVKCAIDVQKKAQQYNEDKKLNLHRLELRISINQWEIVKKKTLIGDDYFGEAVNMSHRLESITPENKIYITEWFYEHIKHSPDFHFYHLGKTTFKGILYEVGIYEVLFDEQDIEKLRAGTLSRPNLNTWHSSEYANKVKEADEIIFTCASVWALLWIQPIPFIDSFNLVPLHIYMLIRIAYVYGVKLSVDEAMNLSKTMIAGIGVSYLTLQWAIWASKVLLPFVAGYVTIPLNFSITYGLWKVFSSYHYHAIYGISFSNRHIKDLFADKRNIAKDLGKKQKDEILKKAKESKDMLIESEIVREIVHKLKGEQETQSQKADITSQKK